jgi:hypothetical protein
MSSQWSEQNFSITRKGLWENTPSTCCEQILEICLRSSLEEIFLSRYFLHFVFHWDTDTVALLHQATMSNKNNADNLQGSQSVAKIHHGAGYTRTEDYLVCKAFIAASKDPFVGTAQKGKDFRKKIHEKYRELLSQQSHLDRLNYSLVTADARLLILEPVIY